MTSSTPGPPTTTPIAITPTASQPSATTTPSTVLPIAATTSSTTPAAVPASAVAPATTSGGGLTAAVLSAVVIAALLTGIVNTMLARRNTRLEERARVRTTLAEAYQAYAAYKEFPYAIRRRRADQPAEERILPGLDPGRVTRNRERL
jgi:hypothetical protein